ncbi:DUF3618 domain-containing protein [Natronomonas sp. F2-12]|uniref:DUF3618 domain-containing protein n=1 Tax=Natronomonas aquatica TaxID=2841590 RepID=A0A9R1CW35_9EURY|nr:DUF3618 domain-containing protein [Natronomonas aquatica]MCQ4334641.1 DUF3618 domain-containing protein [Natronomonas aquatica]
MSDEEPPDPETLRERVRELEQTADDLRETVDELQQRRGPSRRDLLKVGSGGLLGAGLLASSQPVSAAPASADTSAGQVGVAGKSEDMVVDQLYDPGGDEILNVDDSGGINAQFGRVWHFDGINLGSTLDLSGNDLTGVQSFSADTADVTNQLSAGSLNVDGLNSADLANAAADTVPTAQGDGSLSMDPIPSSDGPNKSHAETLEADTPLPVTLSFSETVELVDVYWSTDGSEDVNMQINGNTTSNYNWDELVSGTSHSASSATISGDTTTSRSFANRLTIQCWSTAGTDRITWTAWGGESTSTRTYRIGVLGDNAGSGIDTIDLQQPNNTDLIEYTAIGYNITGGNK